METEKDNGLIKKDRRRRMRIEKDKGLIKEYL